MSRSKVLNGTPDDDLARQLQLLNLTFILEHFEEFAQKAGDEQWTHVEFLAHLIEGEAVLRQDRARERRIKQARFGSPRVEGLPAADWVLIDAGDVVVHLFRPEVRSFYNLERMWNFGDVTPVTAAGQA